MATMVEVRKEKSRMTETIENSGATGSAGTTSSAAKANPALQSKNPYPQGPPVNNTPAASPDNPNSVSKSAVPGSRLEHVSIWVLAVTFVAGLGFLYYFNQWNWNPLQFNVDQISIYVKLTPLVLLAGLIERAVEVVITPWRDPDADDMTSKMVQAKAQAAQPGATDDDQQAMADTVSDLNKYTGKTRQYAYSIALALSVCAAVAGIRTLWPLLSLDKAGVPTFPISAQQLTFVHWFDLVLTALLLTGGAAGLHAPINGFITWIEKKKS
jgi:hypothetical protein